MPSKRRQHSVDESWLEEARCRTPGTTQSPQKPPAAPQAVFDEYIFYNILEFVALLPDSDRRQTLWSCALVSKTWHDIAVHRLYRSPELTTDNVDFFARTVCSGRKNSHTSARIARLKDSVRHLNIKEADQKALKSTIGRILDQVKDSLESYESSTATVNIHILSSLSRCTNLKCLDLTANQCELNFLDILKATAILPKLETLRLPQSVFEYQSHRLQGSVNLRWPPALRNLQLPNFFLWERVIRAIPDNGGWPSTLRSLTIVECANYWPLSVAPAGGAPQIDSFEIGNCTEVSARIPMDGIFALFPNLRKLKIPAVGGLSRVTYEDISNRTTRLEVLEFHPPPIEPFYYSERLTPTGCSIAFTMYIEAFPKLRRMTVPDVTVYVTRLQRRRRHLHDSDGVQQSLQAINNTLLDRSAANDRESSGLFMNGAGRSRTIDDDITSCGVVYRVNAESMSVWLARGVRRWAPQPLLILDARQIRSRWRKSGRYLGAKARYIPGFG